MAATLSAQSTLLLASGRAGGAETETALHALGCWVAEGGAVDWSGVFPDGGRRLELPTYAWQRDRYWIESSSTPRAGGAATDHPLLGVRIATPRDVAYETLLSTSAFSWLAEHRIAGQIVVPGAAIVELVRAALEDYREDLACEVNGAVVTVPLLVQERGAARVQVVLTEEGSRAAVYSQPANANSGTTWTLHATAGLSAASEPVPSRVDVAALRRRCTEPLDVAEVYASFAAAGLEYGASFRGIKRLWRGEGEALAEVELPDGLDPSGYGLHPALLDAALQSIVGLLAAEPGGMLLPFEFGRFVVHELGATSVVVHARLLVAQL